MPIEQMLRLGSAAVQRWLEGGDEVGVVPGEESISDLLLFALSHMPDHQCRVIRLPKLDEARVGPDFVLWFVSDRDGQLVGLPLLVQAKRLYPNGRFDALDKPTFAHPQMALLIAIARRWRATPVYALYQPPAASLPGAANVLPSSCDLGPGQCGVPPGGILPPGHPAHDCAERDEADLGVAIVHAQRVADLVEVHGSQPQMVDLSPLAVPLACLTRCPCLQDVAAAPAEPPAPPPPDGGGPGDLVTSAALRVSRLLEGLELGEPEPVPEWLAGVLQDDPTTVERRSIAREDITADVDTIVIITDVDLQ